MDLSSIFPYILFGFSIGLLITYFNFKKKIEKIGNIKCERCNYQGKPVQYGLYPKIVCPDCRSDRWTKI